MDERISLGQRTLTQIDSWFVFVAGLERSLLWTSFDEHTRGHMLHFVNLYFEDYHLSEKAPAGNTDFLHFSTKSLLLIHAFVVHLVYGYPRKITTKRNKGSSRVNTDAKSVGQEEPAKDEVNQELEAQNATNEEGEGEVDNIGDNDDDDDDDVGEGDSVEMIEEEHIVDQSQWEDDDDVGGRDGDEIIVEEHIVDEGQWFQFENATDWISELTEWSNVSFSLLSPLFQIATWRKNRTEEFFPYLGLLPYKQFSGKVFTGLLTLQPHVIFQQTLELMIGKFNRYEHLLGSVLGSRTNAEQFQIVHTSYDHIKKTNERFQLLFKNQEKNARSNMMRDKYKSSRVPDLDNFTFLFGDHYGVAFAKLFFVPVGDDFEFEGAY